MAEMVEVQSAAIFKALLSSSRLVVVDFYGKDDGASSALSPLFEQIAQRLSKPKAITFARVEQSQHPDISSQYKITVIPTYIIFKSSREVERIEGPRAQELRTAIQKLVAEAESGGMSSSGFGDPSSASSGTWRGAELPRNYADVSDQVDTRGLDLLNSDADFGSAKTLFDTGAPSSLGKSISAKGKEKAEDGGESKKDWVESDTDEQLMLYIPFQSTLKMHTIQITSFAMPLSEADADDDEAAQRPRTIHLYTNRAHNLGFEEAEDITPTQAIELSPEDWDPQTGTARLELRFVKFQNITSFVLFVVSSEGSGEKVRLDRIRIIGESGEKREMGKLQKPDEGD